MLLVRCGQWENGHNDIQKRHDYILAKCSHKLGQWQREAVTPTRRE